LIFLVVHVTIHLQLTHYIVFLISIFAALELNPVSFPLCLIVISIVRRGRLRRGLVVVRSGYLGLGGWWLGFYIFFRRRKARSVLRFYNGFIHEEGNLGLISCFI